MAARLSALRAGGTLPPGFFIFKDSWYSFLLEAESTHCSNSGNSNYILNTERMYGAICDIIYVITTGKEDKYLNTLESYRSYRISKDCLHMNDPYNDSNKPIFEISHELYTRKQHTIP
jgi:hypothetical protein